MKKPSLIIGRKQLILSVLTLILGTAVYLNYVLGGGNGLAAPQGQETSSGDSALDAAAPANDRSAYGTAEMVSASLGNADYFAQARLDKQTSRDNAVQTLQSIIGGGDISRDEMVTNAINAVSLSQLIKSENVIESLILSQGFEDCVVYLDGQTAKVVVETDGLSPAEAAAIKDIVLSEADISAEGIRILEVKS
jgi:stage III sporulation protein AH